MDTEQTYTLADLERFEFPGTPLAVLGHPVRHSISPAMHNAALVELAKTSPRFKDWSYYRFEVPAESLLESLPLFHAKGFLGLNLTVPHKVIALDGVETISASAQQMGAVNTLRRTESGYEGFNTDGYGMEMGIQEALGSTLESNAVILLGSGGAARAAAVQCVQSNASRLYLGNRTPARLATLQALLASLPGQTAIQTFELAQLPPELPETGILINATSLGLKAEDPAPVELSQLPLGWSVYDMIYNPAATVLLQQAIERGHSTANGLSMLIHQGARSLQLWTGADFEVSVMERAALNALHLPK